MCGNPHIFFNVFCLSNDTASLDTLYKLLLSKYIEDYEWQDNQDDTAAHNNSRIGFIKGIASA